MNQQIFEIEGPEPLVIGQLFGVIAVIQKRADFDREMKSKNGMKHATRRIRDLQSFDHLSFTGRPGLPHLHVDDAGNLDISTAGIYRALSSLAVHRDRKLITPDNLDWLFDKYTTRICRVRDWFETVYPALMGQTASPPVDIAEHMDFQRVQADDYARDFWSTIANLTRHDKEWNERADR